MKKTAGKIALILIVVFFACAFNGCVEMIKMTADLVVGAVEIGSGLIETGAMIGEAAADAARAAQDELPLKNLKRISKGVYTVDVDVQTRRYNEKQRNNAINLLVQIIGYESYDFKITSEPTFKLTEWSVWSYYITMPGSIPVVRNDKYSLFKIADIGCTPVPDTTFGESKIIAIAYGDGKFVAVGEDNKMAYSPDGVTWTAVKYSSFNYPDIAYGNGKFVVVGSYYGRGKIAYSSDGINWTDVKNFSFKKDEYFRNIAYGNGMFVAVGYRKIAYSPDGINWTAVKNSSFKKDEDFRNIAYWNGMFVASSVDKLAYSPDGITWTAVKNKSFSDIAYGNGKFVAVSGVFTMVSSDGVNWTEKKTTFGKDSNVRNIVYGNDKFIAVEYYRDTSYSSDDGINWTAGDININAPPFMRGGMGIALAYGDGKFVTGKGSKMAYSSDGINWITIADSAFNAFVGSYINKIIYADGKFIVVGKDGKMAYWDGNVE